MTKTALDKCPAYITVDGSEIRELIHPEHHNAQNQSLAYAQVAPHSNTEKHRHHQTEEIYHILTGEGVMSLGEQQFHVQPGDSILIPPGTAHCIANPTDIPLTFLCCCSPAYHHGDTELLP